MSLSLCLYVRVCLYICLCVSDFVCFCVSVSVFVSLSVSVFVSIFLTVFVIFLSVFLAVFCQCFVSAFVSVLTPFFYPVITRYRPLGIKRRRAASNHATTIYQYTVYVRYRHNSIQALPPRAHCDRPAGCMRSNTLDSIVS